MTTLTRRTFLHAMSAVCAAGPAFAKSPLAVLKAAVAEQQVLPTEYPATPLWTFNGTFPGEALRIKQGDRVIRKLENTLPQSTAVHWHGIRIDNAMDGVPGLTQAAVEPGGAFDYDFAVPDAGTYWYHSHNRSTEQIARGLYGSLIVEEAEGPDVDRDIVLLLDDMRLTQTGEISEDFDSMHDKSHAGRLGNIVLTNGRMDLSYDVQRNQRLRLRLINASNARIFQLGLQGLNAWTVALDGMPLDQPQAVEGSFVIAPAQRVDLIVDVVADAGSEAFLIHFERDGGFAQVTFDVGGRDATQTRPAPSPLPPNPDHGRTDLAAATPIPLVMEGGAMGGMRGAMMGGRRMVMRELVQGGQAWALNGVAGLPEAPLVDVFQSETVRISMRNDTAFPHAMHLHGHHFREVLPDGTQGPLRDTILINRNETRDIAFVAHNPGDWLVHCHMLSHQAAGMKTWMRVQ
ncbi:MAG: multicopper oxidase family protein [Pseudomonadota bacterium]